MKKSYTKVISFALAITIMVSLAVFFSTTGNALTGISGGTNLSNTGMQFTNYSGQITTNSDGSTSTATLNANYIIFYYRPTPDSLVNTYELTLTDAAGNSYPVYGIPGSYGGPNVGYIPTYLYQCSMPHKGDYVLTADVKDIYGYLYSKHVHIVYN